MKALNELETLKGITFTKYKDEVLNSTSEALEQLSVGNLKALPNEQLIRTIKALIALGKQSHNQIQNDISLIAQLDTNCFELISTNEHLEALRSYATCLEQEAEDQKKQESELRVAILQLEVDVNKLLRERVNISIENSDNKQEIRKLGNELKDTKEKLKDKTHRLEDVEKQLRDAEKEHE